MDQYIGKLLDNRYELLERVGNGGMAVVYKARCHRLNRLVAVKILKPDLGGDADFRRRFHDESQAVAMLSHPNIVSVYDVSHSNELDYIVMELIDGITLKQYMQKRGVPLNWREALHFTIQIVKALGHAHSRGIIHRDIKPHNIMVLRDGSIKVTDFGIARLIGGSHSTLTQEALGSVHYISPEQAKGSRIDGRSDLYSAGVVLYELLTGRLPFEGETPVSVAIQHINSIPISPRELNPDIPEALEAITMKAMAPKVDQRYSSADDMLADLEEFRKNPNIRIDYSDVAVQPEEDGEADEPTQVISTGRIRAESENAAETPVRKKARIPERDIYDDDDDDYYEERRGVPVGLISVLVILLFIAGVVAFLWNSFFSSLFKEPVTYQVPNLDGMTLSEIYADRSIVSVFHVIEGDPIYNEDYELGEVVKQIPAAGTTVKETNLTITIRINTEETVEELRMPDVMNWDQRQALTLLQDEMGLVVNQEYEASDTVTEGFVMRYTPIEGTLCNPGDEVTIVISLGPDVEKTTVPLVEGLTLDAAQQLLIDFELVPGNVSEIHSEVVPAGTVILQSTKAYTEVPIGSTVNLQVSLGSANPIETGSPEPDASTGVTDIPVATTTKELRFDLSNYFGTVQLKVLVGDMTVMNSQVDTAIGVWSMNVSNRGTQTVQYFINDVLVKSEVIDFSYVGG